MPQTSQLQVWLLINTQNLEKLVKPCYLAQGCSIMKTPLCYVLVQKFQWIIYRNTNYSLYKQCSCAATIIIFVPSFSFSSWHPAHQRKFTTFQYCLCAAYCAVQFLAGLAKRLWQKDNKNQFIRTSASSPIRENRMQCFLLVFIQTSVSFQQKKI